MLHVLLAGHSRTIVGVEDLRDGSLRLLLFDPSCGKKQMSQFISTEISANLMRTVRRPLSSMKAKQYQIVAIRGVIAEKDYEVCPIIIIVYRNNIFIMSCGKHPLRNIVSKM